MHPNMEAFHAFTFMCAVGFACFGATISLCMLLPKPYREIFGVATCIGAIIGLTAVTWILG